MTHALKRMTTQYIGLEDRFRLTGEFGEGETVTLWLTQRILRRLLPPLLEWLAQAVPRADSTRLALMNEFAQQAARGAIVRQPPIQAQAMVAPGDPAIARTRRRARLAQAWRDPGGPGL